MANVGTIFKTAQRALSTAIGPRATRVLGYKGMRTTGKVTGAALGVAAGFGVVHQTTTEALSRVSGVDPDYNTFIDVQRYINPTGKYPRTMVGKTFSFLTSRAGITAATYPGVRYGSIGTGLKVMGAQASLAFRRHSPGARFRMGMARGFAQQQVQIRQQPIRPYATRGGGRGYPSWYKRKGAGIPAGHLGATGDLVFSLHKMRHRGIMGR